jgi:hypothetical protein
MTGKDPLSKARDVLKTAGNLPHTNNIPLNKLQLPMVYATLPPNTRALQSRERACTYQKQPNYFHQIITKIYIVRTAGAD